MYCILILSLNPLSEMATTYLKCQEQILPQEAASMCGWIVVYSLHCEDARNMTYY